MRFNAVQQICGVCLLLASCVTVDSTPRCTALNLKEFSELVQTLEGEVVFFASWCPFCKTDLLSSKKNSIFISFHDDQNRASKAFQSIPSLVGQCIHDPGEIAALLKVESVPIHLSKKDVMELLHQRFKTYF